MRQAASAPPPDQRSSHRQRPLHGISWGRRCVCNRPPRSAILVRKLPPPVACPGNNPVVSSFETASRSHVPARHETPWSAGTMAGTRHVPRRCQRQRCLRPDRRQRRRHCDTRPPGSRCRSETAAVSATSRPTARGWARIPVTRRRHSPRRRFRPTGRTSHLARGESRGHRVLHRHGSAESAPAVRRPGRSHRHPATATSLHPRSPTDRSRRRTFPGRHRPGDLKTP